MSMFPIIPALYPVGSKDLRGQSQFPATPAQIPSEMPSNAEVILGSQLNHQSSKDTDYAAVATGRVITGYNQKQRAALRKGERDG